MNRLPKTLMQIDCQVVGSIESEKKGKNTIKNVDGRSEKVFCEEEERENYHVHENED